MSNTPLARWNWSVLVAATAVWLVLVLHAGRAAAPEALPAMIVSQGARGLVFAIIHRIRGGRVGSPWRPDPFPPTPRWVYGIVWLLVLAGLVLSIPAMDWAGWKSRAGYVLLFTGVILAFVASPIGVLLNKLRRPGRLLDPDGS